MKKMLSAAILAGSLGTIALADDSNQKSYLFIETGGTAELADGQLVLHGIDDQVSVFSDRPYRSAGVISRDYFLDVWNTGDNSFAANPPNAALSGSMDGKSYVVIVEISLPEVKGDQIAYEYKLIEGDEVSVLENPVMIIDSFSWREEYTGPDGGLP